MKLSLKSNIWFAMLSVVLMFAFFVLFYFSEYTSLMVCLVVLCIGVFIGFLLSKNITVPVLALPDAALKVGEGDRTQQGNSSGKDENDELGSAFNKMVKEFSIAKRDDLWAERKASQRRFHILRSVLALRDAALKVDNGDPTQQVTTVGKDEIVELASAFIKMAQELKNAENERKAAEKQLIQSEKMASLGQMTAGIAHEIKNPLNFVNNFSALSVELLEELEESTDEEDKIEIMESLKSNLKKITAHGKRADSIVATMLQHSRGTVGAKVPTDINQLCTEFTDLAFHGIRANSRDFNCIITKNYDESLPLVNAIPQDLSRVILNLLNNGFYAVADRAKKLELTDYKPEVCVSTERKEGSVFIHVRDNGSGIPSAIKEKIFEPFFTTKPTGEGTGLGLSLSYDIVTKEHQGMMSVESEEGSFTQFTILLPI